MKGNEILIVGLVVVFLIGISYFGSSISGNQPFEMQASEISLPQCEREWFCLDGDTKALRTRTCAVKRITDCGLNEICQGGRCVEPIIAKIVIIQDSRTTPAEEEIQVAEIVAIEKQPDIILFQEQQFGNPYGNFDLYIEVIDNGGYYTLGSTNQPVVLAQINELIRIAGATQTYIAVVARIMMAPDDFTQEAILLIDRSGIIIEVWKRSRSGLVDSGSLNLINLDTREGFSFSAVMAICGDVDISNWGGIENYNADVFLHPSWGGGEWFTLAATEYYQNGFLSQETFDFIEQTFPEPIGWASITSREDMEQRIISESYPFDWIPNYIDYFSQNNVLQDKGYIITADQVLSDGTMRLDKQSLHHLEYGAGYSYIYSEIEIVR